MRFNSTYFHNFRNLQPERLSWSSGLNLITGHNGAGKTNFVEGLNVLSGWGPLEGQDRISSLVKWFSDGREESASLWGRVSGEDELEVFASLSTRCSLKYANKTIRASEMRNRLPVLSFLSEHVSLVKGGASYRRQMLDRVGALVSPSYAKRLYDYRKVYRQKSVLLRRRRDTALVNRLIVSTGSWIWSAREEICRMMKSALVEFESLLSVPMELVFKRGGGGSFSDPLDDFKASLQMKKEEETASRLSLVGPHRDDIKLLCGKRAASIVLSRGQCRRAASALILASALVVERVLGRKPIMVFDEITSELDDSGKQVLFDALSNVDYQTFAVTTEDCSHRGAVMYRMQEGRFV